MTQGPQTLHAPTPLLYSASMSRQAGCNVWLKLENMQPTQSFKIRGVGSLCMQARERGASHFVAVGDTNTALAVAYSGRQLGVPATVFVPGSPAPPIRPKLELEGAAVVEEGRTLRDAFGAARTFVEKTPGAYMVDSAEDTAVETGNATIASEIGVQLQHQEPAAVVAPVGSGALLAGLVSGMQRCGWHRVPVIAVETHNTNSFQQALLADDSGAPPALAPSLLPPLEGPDADSDGKARAGSDGARAEPTVATCLLAGATCTRAVELTREHPVVPLSITEAMAVEACRRFLDDHQLLVEVGSAAALSVVAKRLLHQIVPGLDHRAHVVVVVTGGANTSFDRLDACRQRFPFPAPIIAKSGQEIFMRMLDSALPAAASDLGAVAVQPKSAVSTPTATPAAQP